MLFSPRKPRRTRSATMKTATTASSVQTIFHQRRAVMSFTRCCSAAALRGTKSAITSAPSAAGADHSSHADGSSVVQPGYPDASTSAATPEAKYGVIQRRSAA